MLAKILFFIAVAIVFLSQVIVIATLVALSKTRREMTAISFDTKSLFYEIVVLAVLADYLWR